MKKGSPKRDVAKERFWREVIGRQAGSGQSVRAFCLEAGLKESAFYFWRRELQKRVSAKRPVQADLAASDVEKKDDAGNRDLFIPVVAEPLGKTTAAPKILKRRTSATLREFHHPHHKQRERPAETPLNKASWFTSC